MAVVRATTLAMRMWRNKGEDWREMLEEESRKIKLEMEVEREEKVMSGFWVLEMGRGSRDEGNDNEEFDTVLVSL